MSATSAQQTKDSHRCFFFRLNGKHGFLHPQYTCEVDGGIPQLGHCILTARHSTVKIHWSEAASTDIVKSNVPVWQKLIYSRLCWSVNGAPRKQLCTVCPSGDWCSFSAEKRQSFPFANRHKGSSVRSIGYVSICIVYERMKENTEKFSLLEYTCNLYVTYTFTCRRNTPGFVAQAQSSVYKGSKNEINCN